MLAFAKGWSFGSRYAHTWYLVSYTHIQDIHSHAHSHRTYKRIPKTHTYKRKAREFGVVTAVVKGGWHGVKLICTYTHTAHIAYNYTYCAYNGEGVRRQDGGCQKGVACKKLVTHIHTYCTYTRIQRIHTYRTYTRIQHIHTQDEGVRRYGGRERGVAWRKIVFTHRSDLSFTTFPILSPRSDIEGSRGSTVFRVRLYIKRVHPPLLSVSISSSPSPPPSPSLRLPQSVPAPPHPSLLIRLSIVPFPIPPPTSARAHYTDKQEPAGCTQPSPARASTAPP